MFSLLLCPFSAEGGRSPTEARKWTAPLADNPAAGLVATFCVIPCLASVFGSTLLFFNIYKMEEVIRLRINVAMAPDVFAETSV
jgi:hypothetical protein